MEIIVSDNRFAALVRTGVPKLRIALSNTTVGAALEQQEPAGIVNLALNKPATGSTPCNAHEGPEKAFNGSISGGNLDKWCSEALPAFLQVDLGANLTVAKFVVRHASAGGESTDFNTRDFDIQISTNGTDFTTVVTTTGNFQGVTWHTIAPTLARFVRLNITSPGQQPEIKSSRIYELEVYSSADALQQTHSGPMLLSRLKSSLRDRAEWLERAGSEALRRVSSEQCPRLVPPLWRWSIATQGLL